MRPKVGWTTAEERRLIVDQAFELLGTVGMRFGACESLERLAEPGARVDREAGARASPASSSSAPSPSARTRCCWRGDGRAGRRARRLGGARFQV
jgi:hypothetical protein